MSFDFNVPLKKMMLDRGIETARQLSEVSGVNTVTISELMGNKGNPTLSTLEKISDSLGVDTVEFLKRCKK